MPCSVCGARRIFLESSIICPHCAGLNVASPESIIERSKKDLRKLEERLAASLQSGVNVLMLLESREKVAMRIFADPFWVRENDVLSWFAFSYLLAKSAESPHVESIDLPGLLSIAREVVRIQATLLGLQLGIKVPVVVDSIAVVRPTELHTLDYLPKQVEDDLKKRLPELQDEKFASICLPKDGLNPEAMLARGLTMGPVVTAIKSEFLGRMMRRVLPSRILPFIKSPEDCKSFVEVANQLIALASETLGNDFQSRYGIMALSNKPKEIATLLDKKVSDEKVSWFLDNMSRNKNPNIPLQILVKGEQGNSIEIPTYSLLCLVLSLYQWSGVGKFGDSQNVIGSLLENYIHVYLNGFNVHTRNPVTDEPFLRVPHPERNEEIADVMAFNDQYVFVIESKFWDTPILSDMEAELDKFSKRITYISSNLEKFGITSPKTVVPIFYTPFPPFSVYKDVRLFPSIMAIGVYLDHVAKRKIPELLEDNPTLEKALKSASDLFGGFVDAHQIEPTLEEGRYRIQEGGLTRFDEHEATVLIQNPFGYSFDIYLELSAKTYEEMRKIGIKEGEAIRMAIVDLSGAWTLMQLLYFIQIESLTLEQPTEMKLRSQQLEDIIGMYDIDRTRKAVKELFESKKIDLQKLEDCCKRKGLDPRIAVGRILGGKDLGMEIVQCECGDVLWLDAGLYQRLKTKYGQIKCKRCDPDFFKKLETVAGAKIRTFRLA